MKLIPYNRRGMLWRFAVGIVIVVGFTAATTAVAGLLQVKNIVNDLNLTPALQNARVTLPPPGAPQTLLLIGSDHRAGQSFKYAHTDTMMLVRINDSSSTVNMLSVPRDLKVSIPGYGFQKLNVAYSIGGPNLLIKTLQQQVFPGLQVNHILDVNFRGFSDLIDAIGCVYAQVDHRYYNVSAPGPTNYSSIDIKPGYQKLCGDNQAISGALAFVRFRHTDTDIVRNSRQQDFIRWAKQGYSTGQLLSDRDKLLRIFGANVQTDKSLHSTDGLINLFNLIINADHLTLKSIHFPAILQNCSAGGQTPCYVTATPGAEAAVYRQFMRPTTAAPKPPASKAGNGGGHHGSQGVAAGLTADPSDGRSQAARLGQIGMPIYYPRLKLAGADYCFAITGNCDESFEPPAEYNGSYPRSYVIHDQSGKPHAAYVMTVVVNALLGRYYDVQGTTWQNPPILNNPTQTKTVSGKQLMLFANGGRLSVVAWRTSQGVYWIANTLDDWLSNQQMVGLAASLTRAG